MYSDLFQVKAKPAVFGDSDRDAVINRYSRHQQGPVPPGRQRRATTTNSQNRMCALLLQSDPMLWDYMTRPVDKGGLAYVCSGLVLKT